MRRAVDAPPPCWRGSWWRGASSSFGWGLPGSSTRTSRPSGRIGAGPSGRKGVQVRWAPAFRSARPWVRRSSSAWPGPCCRALLFLRGWEGPGWATVDDWLPRAGPVVFPAGGLPSARSPHHPLGCGLRRVDRPLHEPGPRGEREGSRPGALLSFRTRDRFRTREERPPLASGGPTGIVLTRCPTRNRVRCGPRGRQPEWV